MKLSGNNIIIENKNFSLVLNENCVVESLVYKANGEECIAAEEKMPLFSFTQERPFNNEVKLAHPNKRLTFQANSVKIENGNLVVGFDLIQYQAVIAVKETDDYVTFKLLDITTKGGWCRGTHPAVEIRLVQLSIKDRGHFGEWLNVSFDDKVAVNVLSTSPYERIDAEKRNGCRILYADAIKGIKLKGAEAALIVTSKQELLNSIDRLEKDYNLPLGVESRRGDRINSSIYFPMGLTPKNVDQHIAYAKKAGFSMILLSYVSMFKHGTEDYSGCGDYEDEDFSEYYPGKFKDLEYVIEKIKAAGITPGIHFLHTFIGRYTRYISPKADPRLNTIKNFTIAKDIDKDDTTIYVYENPEGYEMEEGCQVLMFEGELISYKSFSSEYPYRFEGCTRGYWNTDIIPHKRGAIGGILEISESGTNKECTYINQNSDLQDEVATALARIYNAGCEFIYYDGSEGTNPPFEINVPLAQYRVYKKLNNAPIFCEGAAKSHFSWHMLSGGNAFDIFKTSIFKEKIVEHPLEEAGRMANDFTRLNFGWWAYYDDTQPDVYEFGTSRAAAWDCPISMQANPQIFDSNPRTDDNFEVLRRWEDVRRKKWLTKEQKEALKSPTQEHTLLLNGNGEYELVPYEQIRGKAGEDEEISAFIFERNGRNYVVYWDTKGECEISLPLTSSDIVLQNEIDSEELKVKEANGAVILPASHKRYISSPLSKEKLTQAIREATILK